MAGMTLAERAKPIRTLLFNEKVMESMKKWLPANLPPERVARQTITLVSNNPSLLECSPQSILAGMIQAAELNLEMSGVLGHAYLVPRKSKGVKQACFQIGYKGLILLAHRSGAVHTLTPRIVYEKDKFSYSYGLDPKLEHVPSYPGGDDIYYYATAKLASGAVDFEVMHKQEVEEHRDKYAQKPQYNVQEWVWIKNFSAMALKTVLRKICKRLPMGSIYTSGVSIDQRQEWELKYTEGVKTVFEESQIELPEGELDEGEDGPYSDPNGESEE